MAYQRRVMGLAGKSSYRKLLYSTCDSALKGEALLGSHSGEVRMRRRKKNSDLRSCQIVEQNRPGTSGGSCDTPRLVIRCSNWCWWSLIVGILSGIAIPITQSALLHSYQLTAAVQKRYGRKHPGRALSSDYARLSLPGRILTPQIVNTYQVLSEAPPWPPLSAMWVPPQFRFPARLLRSLAPRQQLQFKPNGSVSATAGQMSFSIAYAGTTKTLTVSNYGSISVQ